MQVWVWRILFVVCALSFAVLVHVGKRIEDAAPPIPVRVEAPDGSVLIAESGILHGQHVWQALGGMELGSIWGHGSYVAPDWTADYLHREAVFVLDAWARADGPVDAAVDYAAASAEQQAAYRARLAHVVRTNAVDARGVLVLPAERAEALRALRAYYVALFRDGRAEYALPRGAQPDPEKASALADFFFWTAWAAAADRPGTPGVSYTNNWPHEPLVGNRVTADAIVWTGVSIMVLIAGLAAMVWWRAAREPMPALPAPGDDDPILRAALTPSQRVVLVYFAVVLLLFLLQIATGVLTAHFGVEGDGFYGVPLSRWLPYVVTRTWHTQLGIFWIATAWLAAGLFVAPGIGGGDPPGQRVGAIVLLGALVVVVLGSMAGEWLSVMHRFADDSLRFYFGHSGYEYVDLGRAFQWALFAGLALWIALVIRAVLPALRRRDETRGLLVLFVLSGLAIAGFYGAGLGYGHDTHLSIAEYWRWWVVHLWVEGFFEVFATVVFAFLFARLGLLDAKTTEIAVVTAAAIYLAGGILGTLHHLYFSGTPPVVTALGAVFSALEIVPLVFIGFEGWQHLRLARTGGWVRKYRWPISFFVAVAVWNAVGAGLFGFMINPPVALYFMQGLNTTPVHGHAALFGVYGMLGLALTLFCVRSADAAREWREGPLALSFWLMNGGLVLMIALSLLPVGLMQTRASVEVGYWYARSPEFLHTPGMQTLRWLRVVGDTLFALGALAYVGFFVGLLRRPAPPARPASQATAAAVAAVLPGSGTP